ncbi:Type III Polyketide synthases (Type III PKS) [Aspergillus tanneri]|uniref:Type III Polyketide synthases (Type III PKS) n=1 Tax=Aspergillus tanneri TaxID=1220188 RepID=A0A5M9MEH4_9EURO|nr:Type III Polyketide synthases (Type III PKS) [Aspergillus tanneri]KAA8645341.1 Type III Polyketide synthases (Type III PKS) [Aspergillus tanneri]
MDTLFLEHYKKWSVILEKTLEINNKSRIDKRHSILPESHPIWHQSSVPTIKDCDVAFKEYAVQFAEDAAKKAIADWGGATTDITHVVAATCSNTSSPGFDAELSRRLGLGKNTQRILVQGLGCAGGVAALRTAYHHLLAAVNQDKPARALVISCEAMSIFARNELDNIINKQLPSVAPALFGDCSSAMVLSNGIGVKTSEKEPIWNILGVQTTLLATPGCIEYNIGYLAVITKEVPKQIALALPSGFQELIASTECLRSEKSNFDPATYDWALHPGGYMIINIGQEALGLSPHHLRKTYEAYTTAGNTGASTVLSIMDKLAHERASGGDARDKVVGVAFGPDITMEMVLLMKPSCG